MQTTKNSNLHVYKRSTSRSILLHVLRVPGILLIMLLVSLFVVSPNNRVAYAASQSTSSLALHMSLQGTQVCLNYYNSRVTGTTAIAIEGAFQVDNVCTHGISGIIDLFASVSYCTFGQFTGDPHVATVYYNLGPGKTASVSWKADGQCLKCPNKDRYSIFQLTVWTNATDHLDSVQLASIFLSGALISLHGRCGADVAGNMSIS